METETNGILLWFRLLVVLTNEPQLCGEEDETGE